jgi:hypothetical protein
MTLLKAKRPSATNKEKALAALEDNREETIRMNVNLPKSFHKKVKLIAVNHNTTVTDLVVKALNEYMSK